MIPVSDCLVQYQISLGSDSFNIANTQIFILVKGSVGVANSEWLIIENVYLYLELKCVLYWYLNMISDILERCDWLIFENTPE